jgi:hypothetical protein
MSDSLSNPAFIIRLFTESSATLLTSLLTLKQWCLSAIGPFLIALLLGGYFAIVFARTQFELDEMRKDNSLRRKERRKNNDLKRQILKTELTLSRVSTCTPSKRYLTICIRFLYRTRRG